MLVQVKKNWEKNLKKKLFHKVSIINTKKKNFK